MVPLLVKIVAKIPSTTAVEGFAVVVGFFVVVFVVVEVVGFLTGVAGFLVVCA